METFEVAQLTLPQYLAACRSAGIDPEERGLFFAYCGPHHIYCESSIIRALIRARMHHHPSHVMVMTSNCHSVVHRSVCFLP